MSPQRSKAGPRALLVDTAALVVDDGYSLEQAMRRAAQKHAVDLRRGRPSRKSVQAAVHEYRELFRPHQLRELQEQRCLAAEAMRTFAEFQPRLIGPLVHGDGQLDLVKLLLVTDTPEWVIMMLSDQRIPWQAFETKLHFSGGRQAACPALRFMAGETRVELIILESTRLSDPPRDPITGGPLDSLSPSQLNALTADPAT